MKEIFIDVFDGVFHPCEVLKISKNISNHDETINFFDRATNEYMVGRLKNIKGEYYIFDIKFLGSVNGLIQIKNSISFSHDVSRLPLYLKNIRHRRISKDDILMTTNNHSSHKLIKRLEFLELKSYADALNSPMYYYFIINNVILCPDGYDYDLTFSCVSSKPLKKNIISRHETLKSLDDLRMYNGEYVYRYVEGEKIDYNLEDEKKIVLMLMNLCKSTHGEMDSVLLTKISRMMLSSSDRLKAAREYQSFISEYYDKWVDEDRKYRM